MERDILSSLIKDIGCPHLIEKILNHLDACSLANAELVCRQWRSIITNDVDVRCWKKYLLTKKVTSIPNISSYWAGSGDEESGRYHCKQEWMEIVNFYKKLEANWRSGSCRPEGEKTNEVICFSMNATKIFTAEYVENKFLINTWNRNHLHCERTFQDEGQSVSMDCDNDILVTASIDEDIRFEPEAVSFLNYSIVVRELKSGDVINKIAAGPSHYFGRLETAFKVRFGHGWLISHQFQSSSQFGLVSRLETRRMTNARKVQVNGAVRLAPISQESSTYPIFVGHDEHYIVVHYSDPPRFEVVSTSSLELTRTVDAFDYCRSVQYKNGLIVSGSALVEGLDIPAMIRLWDVETGLCLREIREPWLCSDFKLVGFTTNYLVTVPGPPDNRIMEIRDLGAAMDNNQTYYSTLLATRQLLVGCGYPHLTEKILYLLDAHSLANAELCVDSGGDPSLLMEGVGKMSSKKHLTSNNWTQCP